MTPLPQLSDQARNRWRSILSRLDIPSTSLDGKQRPCPICGGKDRFRFDDKDGNGTWFCNQCGAGNGITLAKAVTGLPFAEMANRIREYLPDATVSKPRPQRDDERCQRAMREVWFSSLPIAGTQAEQYLRIRGCWSDGLPGLDCLRFAPRLRATKDDAGYMPALVAKVTDMKGIGVNIHRTFLRDGARVYRAMMSGPVPDGAAIRLGPASERMCVAEGIETALHAAARFGAPCWSAITAGGLEKWEPPADCRTLIIAGDNDASFTGQAAAYSLARKLTNRKQPISCDVKLPPVVGTDWADGECFGD